MSVTELRPAAVAVERVFFQVNVRTAMSVGQASGLALAVAARAGLSVCQYTPNEVKQAVAGYGARAFAGHEALQHLLATEPGTVLPHLCFSGADTLLTVAADRIGPHLCRFMGPLEARRTAEWLARIVLSYGLAPTPEPAETAVLSVVREFVIPAAEERAGTAGGSPDGTAA